MSRVRRVDPFCSWMKQNSIKVNFEFVEIRHSSNPDQTSSYWSIFARKDVPEGSTLAWIPNSALLSPRNSELQGLMEEESIGSGLALVITLMYERSSKTDSKWSGYLKSLPEREYLPVFWSEKELEPLKSTPLFNAIHQERQFMMDDFDEIVKPFLDKFPAVFGKQKLNLEDFMNAASIVSSRDFYIDSEHGRALVPFADVFNHKCCIVANEDHVLQAQLPDFDHQPKSELDQTDPDKQLEILICNSVDTEGIEGLEIKTAQFIRNNNEIHNTYGELSNRTLLMKYGFCLHQNPFDYVSIDIYHFLFQLENSIEPVSKTTSTRFQILKDTIDEDELDCFRLFPDGTCCGLLASILEFLFSSTKPTKEITLDLEVDTPPINIPYKSYQHTKALSKTLLKLMEVDLETQSSIKVLFECWKVILSQAVSYLDTCLEKARDSRNHVVSLQQEEDFVYNLKSSSSSSSHKIQRDRKQDFVKIWCRTD